VLLEQQLAVLLHTLLSTSLSAELARGLAGHLEALLAPDGTAYVLTNGDFSQSDVDALRQQMLPAVRRLMHAANTTWQLLSMWQQHTRHCVVRTAAAAAAATATHGWDPEVERAALEALQQAAAAAPSRGELVEHSSGEQAADVSLLPVSDILAREWFRAGEHYRAKPTKLDVYRDQHLLSNLSPNGHLQPAVALREADVEARWLSLQILKWQLVRLPHSLQAALLQQGPVASAAEPSSTEALRSQLCSALRQLQVECLAVLDAVRSFGWMHHGAIPDEEEEEKGAGESPAAAWRLSPAAA